MNSESSFDRPNMNQMAYLACLRGGLEPQGPEEVANTTGLLSSPPLR